MRNKNNIRKKADTYQEWLKKREGYDPESLEEVGESATPYSIGRVSPALDDMYENLENLYYSDVFKGRQKQIIGLLLEGHTNQVEMAEILGMKQGNLSVELRKIMKKIL